MLLPVRGAVAAAMLCPTAGEGTGVEWTAKTEATHHHMSAADHAHHEHSEHSDGHHSDSSAKCNLCCGDFCSMTLLLSSLPSVVAPQDLSSISFPDFSAPAPSFLSDGQERPPRST